MAGLDLHIPDKTICFPTLSFFYFIFSSSDSHILANISTYTHVQCGPNGKCTTFCFVLSRDIFVSTVCFTDSVVLFICDNYQSE